MATRKVLPIAHAALSTFAARREFSFDWTSFPLCSSARPALPVSRLFFRYKSEGPLVQVGKNNTWFTYRQSPVGLDVGANFVPQDKAYLLRQIRGDECCIDKLRGTLCASTTRCIYKEATVIDGVAISLFNLEAYIANLKWIV
jgi:hypothetical protein